MKSILLFVGYFWLAAVSSGCGPTYPKEQFADSIVRLCKKEYNLDVKAEVAGKTVTIYAPIRDLWDMTFALTEKAGEEINNVILSVSRVALSTDAKYDFYVVIAHDIRIPEIQIIIIKYVDDVKRFFLNDISRGEFSKRMLVDKRLNPQSRKEFAIKEVFAKMGLDSKWQDAVMNDFFRSQPTAIGDIGYWNGRFYIKDISLPEYLAEQIAARIKMEFFEDKALADAAAIKSSSGSYSSEPGRRSFRINIRPEPKTFSQLSAGETSNLVLKKSLEVCAHVLRGYHYEEYDFVEITDEAAGKSIKAVKNTVEKFRQKKIRFDDILSQAVS